MSRGEQAHSGHELSRGNSCRVLSRAMSSAASVAALRTLFGVPDDAPLLEAIQVMNISMGIVGEGPLPKQVQALVDATGVNLQPPLEG